MADFSEGEILLPDFVSVSGDSLEAQLIFLNNLRGLYNGKLIYLRASEPNSATPILKIERFSLAGNCFLSHSGEQDSILYITFLDYWLDLHRMPFDDFLKQLVVEPSPSS